MQVDWFGDVKRQMNEIGDRNDARLKWNYAIVWYPQIDRLLYVVAFKNGRTIDLFEMMLDNVLSILAKEAFSLIQCDDGIYLMSWIVDYVDFYGYIFTWECGRNVINKSSHHCYCDYYN